MTITLGQRVEWIGDPARVGWVSMIDGDSYLVIFDNTPDWGWFSTDMLRPLPYDGLTDYGVTE